MSRNTSVSLGEHFAQFIDRQVEGDVTAPPAKSSVPDFVFWRSRKPPSTRSGPR